MRNGARLPLDAPIRSYDQPQISHRRSIRPNRKAKHLLAACRRGGGAELLTDGGLGQMPRSFSPDGRTLANQEANGDTRGNIWMLRMADRKAQPFLTTPANEGAVRFSPDGRWLAYVSDESGWPEIFVQPFPATGGKWQVSTDGGTEPAWNRNGRELFYRSGTRMMAVDVATESTFSAGKPRTLFEGNYASSQFPLTGFAYDVSADGQRFLMIEGTGGQGTATAEINVVQNWQEELKRFVPTK